MSDTKTCTRCKKQKPIDDFRKHKNYPDGYHCWCRSCQTEYSNQYRKGKGRKKHLRNKRRQNIRKYGIEPEEYERLLLKQNFACAVCKAESYSKEEWKHFISGEELNGEARLKLSIDHCHNSNKVRGLLCSECNNGIGKLKDDPDLLRVAIDYLERERA